jgi:hypothetical protein
MIPILARPYWLVLVVPAISGGLVFAQGGPPFRTDDPDTPGNRNWELNFGLLGQRNPFAGEYEVPNIDLNYGLGHRVQLKFEIPLSVTETRGDDAHVLAGPGNSLLGVKWRFYAHHPKSESGKPPGEKESTFGLSVYPQLMLNNPTRSVDRGIAEPAPQFLLPVEASAVLGPIRISGEVGYWFTGKDVPRSWIRGVIVGHEFRKDTELYAELFDQKEVGENTLKPALRDTTLGIGGRVPITPGGRFRIIAMGGHSVVSATPTNGQPGWIAYVGIQFLSSSSRRRSSDYMAAGGR